MRQKYQVWGVQLVAEAAVAEVVAVAAVVVPVVEEFLVVHQKWG